MYVNIAAFGSVTKKNKNQVGDEMITQFKNLYDLRIFEIKYY